MLACCAMAANAQDVPVNREKYPDYVDPRTAYKPEPRLMKYVQVAFILNISVYRFALGDT